MKIVLASLAAIAIASPALAQSATEGSNQGFSASVGYSHWDADDGSLGAVTARGRYMFTNYVGGEVEASFGVKDESGYGYKLSIDNSFGGFAVLGAPVTERFDVFGRLGYATTSLMLSTSDIAVRQTSTASLMASVRITSSLTASASVAISRSMTAVTISPVKLMCSRSLAWSASKA